MDDVRELATKALTFDDGEPLGGASFSEVPFGGAEGSDSSEAPWDVTAPVEIPGTGFKIRGYIDRLDLSPDRLKARVRDYKTGRSIDDEVVLNGGKELQRGEGAPDPVGALRAATRARPALPFPRWSRS